MKNLKRNACLMAALCCCCFVMIACNKTKEPQTLDTSAVAGTYYKLDEEDNPVASNWIKLNNNGTWASSEPNSEDEHTFKLGESGVEISMYVGDMKVMYGTISGSMMTLQVYVIVAWEDAMFTKI